MICLQLLFYFFYFFILQLLTTCWQHTSWMGRGRERDDQRTDHLLDREASRVSHGNGSHHASGDTSGAT
jgi:hypothetical protein